MFLNKKFILIFITIILAIGGYWYYTSKNNNQIQFYFTAKPLVKDLEQYVNASGNLKAKDQITVGSLVAGRIIRILADDNDFVKKDDVLIEIDDGRNYSAVKKAKALLEEAQATLEFQEKFTKRQEVLYKAGQLAQNTFEEFTRQLKTKRAIVKQFEAELELAQQTYDNLFIKAPDDGIVIAKKVDLGQMITSRLQATELYIIAKDLKKMEVEVDVDEADVGMVKEGQITHFTVDAFPNIKFSGKVRQIRYLAKTVENVVTYAAIVDVANPTLKLRPGMTTDIYINVAGGQDTLCVPNKALRIYEQALEKVATKMGYKILDASGEDKLLEEKDYLWIFDGKKTFEKVPVELGVNDGKYTQIVSGLDPNAQVVTEAFDPDQENILLKAAFKGKGGIGS